MIDARAQKYIYLKLNIKNLIFDLATVIDMLTVFGVIYLIVGGLWLVLAIYYQSGLEL